MWVCSKCGLHNSNPVGCNRCQAPPPAPVPELERLPEPWSLLRWYWFLKLCLVATGCVGVGIWLLTSPTFRTNPEVMTFGDALPGVAALVVGLFLLGVVGLVWVRG